METDTLTAPIAEHAGAVPISEAIAQAEEAVAVDRPLPGFEPPPYDAAGWNRKIASKNRGVASAHTAWELARDKQTNAKKILDRESKELSDLIVAMDQERRYAEGELVQPSLKPVSQGVASSSCRYEQLEGKPCPVCILLKASGCLLPDPEDTEHYEDVLAALEPPDGGELAEWIAQVNGPTLTNEQVAAWTDEQRAEVQLWCAVVDGLEEGANMPAWPAVLAPPADEVAINTEAGTIGQVETLDDVAAAHKVCLCQEPDFLVPVDKQEATDARCTKCDGAPTGDTYQVRFAQAPKAKKAKR